MPFLASDCERNFVCQQIGNAGLHQGFSTNEKKGPSNAFLAGRMAGNGAAGYSEAGVLIAAAQQSLNLSCGSNETRKPAPVQ